MRIAYSGGLPVVTGARSSWIKVGASAPFYHDLG
jgi:hypothetical protein